MKLFKVLQMIAVLLVMTSCWLLPQEREDVQRGAAAGGTEFLKAIPTAATAMETGGWTAALITLIFGAVKGVKKGLSVSRERLIETSKEGVKRANGHSTP